MPPLSSSSQPYLDGEEGDVGELLHKAPDLVLASYGVEPGPASHLHLGPEAAAPSAPGPAPGLPPLHWALGSPELPGAGAEAQPLLCPVTFWHRESTNHSSPRKLQAMSTSPLYTRMRYFCGAGGAEHRAGQRPRAGRRPRGESCPPSTYHGSQQLQVLLVHLHVEALVAAVHLEAGEEASAPGSSSPSWPQPGPQLAHLHTCHSGASGGMWRAFRTSGEFRYMVGAVELVHGGSMRTFLRATGIRNRFWKGQERPCSSCSSALLPGRGCSARSAPRQRRWAEGVTAPCHSPVSRHQAHLPPGELQRHPDEGVSQVVGDEVVALVPAGRPSRESG